MIKKLLINKIVALPILGLISFNQLCYLKVNSQNFDHFDYQKYVNENDNSDFKNYVLGPQDALIIRHRKAFELDGKYIVDPSGNLYLPRLGNVLAQGLTLEELKTVLEEKYKEFILNPEINLKIYKYRAVKVFVKGEVQKGGFFVVSEPIIQEEKIAFGEEAFEIEAPESIFDEKVNKFPTVFSALSKAEGITPYADLNNIKVIRRNSLSSGNELMQATISLVSLLTEGDQTQNIRIYDGDIIKVGKSEEIIKDQILRAARINLNPDSVNVFVSGRVNQPGLKTVPQGYTLNQAIVISGGRKVLKGNVEFVRFTNDGSLDRRIISFNPKNEEGSKNNPVLQDGDIIRVKNSMLSASAEALREVSPSILSLYAIFKIFADE